MELFYSLGLRVSLPSSTALARTCAAAYRAAGYQEDCEVEAMALLSARSVRAFALLMVLVLLAGGAVAWVQRERLLTWYYLRNLMHATEANAATCIQRVASRGESAVPGLLDCMTCDDLSLCLNARTALERIGNSLPQGEPSWNRYTGQIVAAFPRLSVAGQRGIMAMTAEWLQPSVQPSHAAFVFGGRMLGAASAAS